MILVTDQLNAQILVFLKVYYIQNKYRNVINLLKNKNLCNDLVHY